ncbi:MAG: single-stranded DNA-binding protein [Acholeplasmataceae bacterium]|jgi:single-strand DNA-binding protein
MINKTILVGRITKDPEVKYTQTNIAVCRFTLAVNRTFTDAQGERQADFITCVAWRKTAEVMNTYVKKGALLGIEGRIQTGQYDAEDGTTRYTTEVVCDSVQFLESRSENTQSQDTPYVKKENNNQSDDADVDEFYQTSKQLAAEDDLPF